MSTQNLPGDATQRARIARMIRVDHAGEYGAKRIYQGQLAVLGRGDKGDLIRHMQAQEQVHLDAFSAMIAKRLHMADQIPLFPAPQHRQLALINALGTVFAGMVHPDDAVNLVAWGEVTGQRCSGHGTLRPV